MNNDVLTEKHFQKPVAGTENEKFVQFVNFSDDVFEWKLNGMAVRFQPGEVRSMEKSVAEHFAKHLINRELLKMGRENDVSPKIPKENQFFMELYNKAIVSIPTASEFMNQDLEQPTRPQVDAPNTNKSAEPEFEELLPPDDDSEEE